MSNGNGGGAFQPLPWLFGIFAALVIAATVGWVTRIEGRGERIEAMEREQAVMRYRMDQIEETTKGTNEHVLVIRGILEREVTAKRDAAAAAARSR